MWWWRKPITHARALWILIVLAVLVFGGVVWYMAAILSHRTSETSIGSRARNVNGISLLSSMFGTVKTLSSGRLEVDSKQSFHTILYNESTSVTSIGGGHFDMSTLKAGATLAATGKDMGKGELQANAIAIIQNGQ